MGENYPTLHDLVRYGQEREKAQLRLTQNSTWIETAIGLWGILLLGAVLVGAVVLGR